MASTKKDLEAFITLKFMYQDDEDDDMEDAERNSDKESGSGGQDLERGEGNESESSKQLDRERVGSSLPDSAQHGNGCHEAGEALQNANSISQEKMLTGNIQITVQRFQGALNDQIDISLPDPIENDADETREEGDLMATDIAEDDAPLVKFLPPPLEAMCPVELQIKINKFLAYKRHGKSFNSEVHNRKDYRNPDFLLHAVRYQDIDHVGSCFSKEVFDPHGYDHKSDFYDVIEADMKREMDRKEQERKRSPKVDFVSGGTQVAVAAAAKINMSVLGSLPPASAAATHAISQEGRHSKKSKWDKVDGDKRNVIGGGQDSVSAAGAHVALLSAASVGSGYAVFAQQKQKEAAEGRRFSERK